MLALTATAPPSLIKQMTKELCMQNCEVIKVSPNRKNVFLRIRKRLSNMHGIESYDNILRPIADELDKERETFPVTIIYMRLKYCGLCISTF